MPYLTTSRQSPSADKRKYSSPGRSWHSSSMFCSASSSSCLLTRTSAVTVVKKKIKREKNKRMSFLLSFLCLFLFALLCFRLGFSFVLLQMIKGEFISQILIFHLSFVLFNFPSLNTEWKFFKVSWVRCWLTRSNSTKTSQFSWIFMNIPRAQN